MSEPLTHDGQAQALVLALQELRGPASGFMGHETQRALDDAQRRLEEARFNLVVLGEFKRGKSTLINALLRNDLLPTAVVPLTAIVTVIAAGPRERLLVRHLDGRERERPIADLASYVTEAENPRNARGVERVRVELDHPLLRAGVEIVDTPGVGSIHSHNTETARGFLPHVDAAICVLDVGQPLSDQERRLLIDVADRVRHTIIVVNKIDHVGTSELGTATAFIQAALGELLPDAAPELLAVSAHTGDGIPELIATVERLAGGDRRALVLRSLTALALHAVGDVISAVEFELGAMLMPLDDLERRAQLFQARIADLHRALAESIDLLNQGVRRAIAETVNRPLMEHAKQQRPRLEATFRRRADDATTRSPRQLARELDAWIDETVRAEFSQLVPRVEERITEQLTTLEERYAARIQTILADVRDAAADVFGASFGELSPALGLHRPSRFTFKLKDVEHALDILVGVGRTVTPGPLGRRLVVRAAEQRLLEMTDRHAGRLRSELAARVAEAVRDYQRELAASVHDAIELILAAVTRAVDERRQGEERTRRRSDELKTIAAQCRELEARFTMLAMAPAD